MTQMQVKTNNQLIACDYYAMSKTSKFQLMELIEKKEMALFFPNHVKSKCVYLLKNRQNFLAVLSNLIERD